VDVLRSDARLLADPSFGGIYNVGCKDLLRFDSGSLTDPSFGGVNVGCKSISATIRCEVAGSNTYSGGVNIAGGANVFRYDVMPSTD
jgi:hypothetical protein